MLKVIKGKKEYEFRLYSNGIKFRLLNSNNWTFITKKMLKIAYNKLNSELTMRLSTPQEKRDWIPELNKRKSSIYDTAFVLYVIFSYFEIMEGFIFKKTAPFDDLPNFDEIYVKSIQTMSEMKEVTVPKPDFVIVPKWLLDLKTSLSSTPLKELKELELVKEGDMTKWIT